MMLLVSQHAHGATGWEIAAAIGTIAGAVATFLAVATAVWLGIRDRRGADAAVQEQLRAARERQAEEHAELRDRQKAEHAELRKRQGQEHEIEFLLSINEQLARALTHGGAPQQREAQEVMRGLFSALPDREDYDELRRLGANPGPVGWATEPIRRAEDLVALQIREAALR